MAKFRKENKNNQDSQYNNGIVFNGVPKKNAIIIFAVVDKDYNMYIQNDGKISKVGHVPEHFERMNLMTDGSEFAIDQLEYESNNNKGIPWRFNRVYTECPDDLDKSGVDQRFTRFYSRNDMIDNFRSHETFKNKPLCVVGSSELLKSVAKYADKIFITRINDDLPKDAIVLDKFPVDTFRQYFTKKEVIQSDRSEALKKMNSGLRPSDVEIEVISEYIKTTKRVAKEKTDSSQSSDYYFEIFSK